MNEEIINDLKQFIVATVTQSTSHLATKEDIANMATKDDIANMATKDDIAVLNQRFDDMDLKMDTIADALAEDIADHEQRISKFESHAV
jgi:hypothetical protein